MVDGSGDEPEGEVLEEPDDEPEGEVPDAPDDESEGEVPEVPDEDGFAFFVFLWCFFGFSAFGWVSVPAAPLAPVSDAPELADGLVAPEVADEPDVPEVPELSPLMPEDEVPLDPDDGNEGDDDMLPPESFALELEGEVALLLLSAPVPWASAMEDTDATRTNDNDWIVDFNVMSNSLGWKKGIIDAAAWMRGRQARSPARRCRRAKVRQFFSSPLKNKDFLTM